MILSKLRILASMAALGALCLALSGCGGGGGSVEGTVKVGDQPVDGGTIMFVPQASKDPGIERFQQTAEIKGGKYSLSGRHGLVPGMYDVHISWKKKTGQQIVSPNDPPNMIDEEIEQIPEEYRNTKNTVEVKAGANQLDFPIQSASKNNTVGD
jgi:hypothetical protein